MRTYFRLSILCCLVICAACGPSAEDKAKEQANLDMMQKAQEGSEKYADYGENPFFKASEQAVSTFSIDADGASYSNTRRFLSQGQKPPVASVRIEEYINYFSFDYPEPGDGENVSSQTEIANCPWNTDHHLIRIGLKGKSIPKSQQAACNYVFLIDVSGSMDSSDKLGILKAGFKQMVDGLRSIDRVAIVTYAGSAGILLPSTHGDQKDKIREAINHLSAGGSTAGAEGINTAYEIATENLVKNGNNRVILGTDGDFNVGVSSTDELIRMIEQKRETGIYLTVLGVGEGNLNDEMMEQLANKGNGNYEYIDNARQIKKIFVDERSRFQTVAKDCKIQITFNSMMVEQYRLIGYENRVMSNADFKNDSVDAGEIGSGQTITALYEVVLKRQSSNEAYATFDIRYKKPSETESRLLSTKIQMKPLPVSQSSENMKFVASVAGFGLLMKDSKYKGDASKQMVLDFAESALSYDPNGYRKEYIEMIKSLQ